MTTLLRNGFSKTSRVPRTTIANMATMKAARVHKAGGPEVLQLEQIPIPSPKDGEVLIKIKATGLNRAEMFTRQGHSPDVQFPRVIGIEAVGLVESCPSNEFEKGDKVATCMGGLGRQIDGGYAEYTCVPAKQVQKLPETKLSWEVLGAIPEMFQTTWGALFLSLKLKAGEKLLIRGGTSSIGLTAASIAKTHGVKVISTSRSLEREQLLRDSGADEIVVDNGNIAEDVKKRFDGGVDKVLELVGTATLKDSLQSLSPGGIVCMAGILGNEWALKEFDPFGYIPSGRYLTTYGGNNDNFLQTPYEELIRDIEKGTLKVSVGKVFKLDEIVEAHRCMEENRAGGKLVVLM